MIYLLTNNGVQGEGREDLERRNLEKRFCVLDSVWDSWEGYERGGGEGKSRPNKYHLKVRGVK